ncbi:MAG: tetratricopeptide repeat protein, partial [Myxococcota bacterium]
MSENNAGGTAGQDSITSFEDEWFTTPATEKELLEASAGAAAVEQAPAAAVQQVEGREDVPKPAASDPGLPMPVPRDPSTVTAPLVQQFVWQTLATELEREARALPGEPVSANAFHESGRVWEMQLGQTHNAASLYKAAYVADQSCTPNLESARRLFGATGNWQEAAQLAVMEMNSIPQEMRAQAWMALCMTRQFRLADAAGAAEALDNAIAVAGVSEAMLAAADVMYMSEPSVKLEVQLFEMAASTVDVQLKKTLFMTRGHLLENGMKDVERALESYQAAWAAVPGDRTAFANLVRLMESTGRISEMVAMMRRQAAVEGGEEGALLLLRASRLSRTVLKELEGSAELMAEAARLGAGSQMVLMSVADEYEAVQDWAELCGVLESLTTLAGADELPTLYFRIGDLLSEKLGREADAAVWYRKALDLNPAFTPAASSLGRILKKTGRLKELAALYELEAANARDTAVKVGNYFKLAEIFEFDLHQGEDAAAAYVKVLELMPAHNPTLKALERLYSLLGRHRALLEIYELQLGAAEDTAQAVFLLDRMGLTCEEKLGDFEGAEGAYRRILGKIPGNLQAIRSLARVYTAGKKWHELLEMIDLEAGICRDQKRIVSLLHRKGEVLEDELGESVKAAGIFRKVIEMSPAHLPSLKALGRIYQREGRHAELIEMYGREAAVLDSNDKVVSLLFKIAEIQADDMGDTTAAIATLEKILGVDPAHLPALKALEAVYLRTGDMPRLLEASLREAAALSSPAEKAAALFRSAGFCLDSPGMEERAIAMLMECMSIFPGHVPSLRALERLYAARSMWRDLAGLYETAVETSGDDAGRIYYLFALASVQSQRLGNIEAAVLSLERVLALAPRNTDALSALDVICTTSGDHEGLHRTLERWLAAADTAKTRLALCLRLGMIEETIFRSPNAAAGRYIEALKIDPSCLAAYESLETLYMRAGDAAGGIALCRHRLGGGADPVMRRDLRMRIAHLIVASGGSLDDAAVELREAAGLDRGEETYLPALLMLRGIYSTACRWTDLLAVIDRIAGTAKDAATITDALVEAGGVLEDILNEPVRAANIYIEAFGVDQADERVFGKLERNLSMRGEWAQLAGIYDDLIGSLQDPRRLSDLCTRSAKLLRDKLGKPEEALTKYAQAVSIDPSSVPVLEALSELQMAMERWNDAAGTLERLVEVSADPTVRLVAHRKLGSLYHDRLADPQRASRHFQGVLTQAPDDPVALEHMAETLVAEKTWPAAIDVYRRLLPLAQTNGKQARYLMALATVYQDGYSDMDQSQMLLWKALELDPGNEEIIVKLRAILEKQGNHRGLVEGLDRLVSSIPVGDRLSAVPLMLVKADALFNRLGDRVGAAAEYRKVLEIAPKNIHANAALAGIYGSSSETYQAAIDTNRKLVHIDPARVDSYRALARIFMARSDAARAAAALSVLKVLRAITPAEEAQLAGLRGKHPFAAVKLDGVKREQFLVHQRSAGPLRRLMSAISGDLFRVYPQNLDKLGVARGDRIAAKSRDPLRQLCDEAAAAVGVEFEFEIYPGHKPGLLTTTDCGELPAVVVGRDLARQPRAQQFFSVARALSYIRDGQAIVPWPG